MREDRTYDSRSRVVAIGPFPPAVTGAAKNTAIVCNQLEARGVQVRRIATNKSRERADHVRSLAGYAEKTVGSLGNVGRILGPGGAGSGQTTAYLVPDGGLGAAFSLAYARAASTRYPRLVVHHRSYNHIVNPSGLMARLLTTAPGRTLHVFLDPVMEERFASVYSARIRSCYVPNAATCDVEPADHRMGSAPTDPVTVGFLSNLVEDKGFDVVAEAFGDLNRRLGSRVRFLLAGRPVSKGNADRLEELKRALRERLDYRGEVFGAEKTDFFRACDIFLFPTRHSQEAQPNVLYEAMAAGSLIVSTRWAGVPWILQGTDHRLVDPGPDRSGEVVAAVEELIASGDLGRSRIRQTEAFRAKKADADARYGRLLDYLAGAADL